MRSWGNRPDCTVIDEPLYAFYLSETGLEHPGRSETLASQPHDWQAVAKYVTGPIPEGKSIWYQKQMAHHLLPSVDQGWIDAMVSCFLIRDPREMITSLIEFIPSPTAADTGLPQQVELFNRLRKEKGVVSCVIDSKDVLDNPAKILGALCDRLSVPFDDAMLSWPAGARSTDGAWAPYWYEKVNVTTNFASYRPKPDEVPAHLTGVYEECLSLYQLLYSARL